MAKRQQKTLRMSRILSLEGSLLAEMAKKAQHHETVERVLREALGSPLADHVALGSLDSQRLVLVTDSPVWSNRIRYQARAILASIEKNFNSRSPARLEIKIVPNAEELPGPRRQQVAISSATAKHLEEVAAACDEKDPLRARLQSLARRATTGRADT